MISCRLLTALIGLCLVLAAVCAPPAQATVSVATSDGLVLTLGDDGSWHSLSVDGNAVPELGGAAGGFLVEPMDGVRIPANRDTFYAGTPIAGAATQDGDDVTIVGTAEGLDFDITLNGGGPYIGVDGTVTGTGTDRVFLVYFRIPVAAGGWLWANDINDVETIDSSPSNWYFSPAIMNQSRHPYLSDNPFGTITKTGDPQMGLSLAPLFYPPCAYAIQYNGNGGFWIEFELGVTPKTAKHPNRAEFHFVLYKHDPEWGNRSAVKRYHTFFPQWFQKVSRGGNWCYDSTRPTDPADFALVYMETYNWDDDYTMANNIYTCKYQEPWCWHLHWLTEAELEQAAQDIPENDGAYCPAKGQSIKASAQQAILSGCKNPDETYIGPDEADYWTDGTWECGGEQYTTVRYITNPDVEIPNFRDFNPGRNRAESVEYWEWYRWWGTPPGPDDHYSGLYHDSVGGWWAGWGVVHNFADEHWAHYDYSPGIYQGWDFDPGQVCMWAPYSNVEFGKYAYEQMVLEDRVVMANSFANYELFMMAPFLDMFGAGESVGWGSLHSESILRAVACGKPVSYLGGGANEAAMLSGMPLCVYPGFSLGSDYESYRSLYQQYMPIYNALDAAGWEPVTNARPSNPSMLLERFGPDENGVVYFVVRAQSEAATDITIDGGAMGWAPYPTATVSELIYGDPVTTSYDGSGDLVIECGTLAANDNRAYRVEVTAPPNEAVVYPDTWGTWENWAEVTVLAGSLADLQAEDDVYMVAECNAGNQRYSMWYTVDSGYAPDQVAKITIEYQARSSRASNPQSLVFVRWGDGSWEHVDTKYWDTSDEWYTWQTTDVSTYMGSDGVLGFEVCGCPQSSDIYTVSSDVLRFRLELTQGPEADFSASPTSGEAPLTVDFTDLSTNSPTAWSWDFGDGEGSGAQNPTHDYAGAGSHTVSLTASNAAGQDTETKPDYITVSEPSEAVVYADTWSTYENWAEVTIVSGGLSDLQAEDDVYMVAECNASNQRYSLLYTAHSDYTPAQVTGITIEYQANSSQSGNPESLVFIRQSDGFWEYVHTKYWDTSDEWYTWQTTDVETYMSSDGTLGFSICGCPQNSSMYTISSDVLRFRLELAGQ